MLDLKYRSRVLSEAARKTKEAIVVKKSDRYFDRKRNTLLPQRVSRYATPKLRMKHSLHGLEIVQIEMTRDMRDARGQFLKTVVSEDNERAREKERDARIKNEI